MDEPYPCPHLPGDLRVTSLTCSARYTLGQKLGPHSSDSMVDRYSACKTCEIGRHAHTKVKPAAQVSQETTQRLAHVQYVSKGSLNSATRIGQETQAWTLALVTKHPGITTHELARVGGVSVDAARARLRRVAATGAIISVERAGPDKRKVVPQWFLKETYNG